MRLTELAIDLGPLRGAHGRAFRVVFTARLVSIFGLGFALVALPLQVYATTHSSVWVAVVSTVNGVSVFCGTLVGGLLADRVPRRTLMVAGRGAATFAFTGLAANALWPGPGSIAIICACALLNGVIGTFSTVALQAAVPGLVPREKLPAAGALLALTGQLGSVAAPALSGTIIAVWGFAAVFGITAAVSLLTTVVLCLLPPMVPDGPTRAQPVLRSFLAGLRFALGSRLVGPLMLLGFAQLLLATPYVLIPELTDRVLHGGEATAGLLYSASALGAVCASLSSGWTGRVRRTGACLLGAVAVCGLASAALGAAPTLGPAIAALTALGFAEIVEEILRFSLLQAHTPDELRGRVNSVWTAQNTVGGSLGAMTLGAVAPLIGAGAAIMAGGALTVAVVAALAALAPGLRRAAVPGGTPVPAPSGGD